MSTTATDEATPKCDIKAMVKGDLRNNWGEKIAAAGEEITITAIYSPNGLYSYQGIYGNFTVPRSWLVECGALEPLPTR